MESVLHRLTQLLSDKAASLFSDLRAGATGEKVESVVSRMRISMPIAVLELYRWRDGQEQEHDGLFGGWAFVPLEESYELWAEWGADDDFARAVDGAGDGVRPEWWCSGGFPIATSLDGNLLCVDTEPAAGGRTGQIIRVLHDEGERVVIADSVNELLKLVEVNLESGKWRDDEGWMAT